VRGKSIVGRRPRAGGEPMRPVRELLAPFLRAHRLRLAVIAGTAFVGGLLEAGVLVVVARSALAIASGDRRFFVPLGPFGRTGVWVREMLMVAGVLVVMRVLLQVLQASITARTFAELGQRTRRELLALSLGASWSVQSTVAEGRLQELVSSVALAATGTAGWVVVGVVAGLSFAALILTAFAVNALASIIVGALALLLAAAFHPLRRAVRRRSRRVLDANVDLATSISELSNLMQEIRIFEAEDAVRESVGAQIDRSARLTNQQRLLADVIPAVYQGVALGTIVGALAIVYAAGVSRLSSLSAVVLIMLRSLTYGQSLQRAIQGVHESAPNLELLTEEIESLRRVQIPRGGAPVPAIGTLTFERVSYSYDGALDALHGVSFETRRGEVIGIVGPSGSGKTTLMQIILRLRDPTSGRVLADGIDVSGLSLDDWYHHVTFVPQEARLFAGTIADNIRFHRDWVTDEHIVEASLLANLHDEVVARGGYDTPVGPQGRGLSGGQRQRLCIARALVERPDILVLDEPTSALDNRSEALIRHALARVSRATTIFIVAHRLSTLAICDRIMVLQGGNLAGFDRPDRLEQTTPFYREALQLAGLK